MAQYNKKVYIYAGLTVVVLVLGVLGIYFLVRSEPENPTNNPTTPASASPSGQTPKTSEHAGVNGGQTISPPDQPTQKPKDPDRAGSSQGNTPGLERGHQTNSPATSIPDGQTAQKPEESDHTESISQTSTAGSYTEIASSPSAVCTKPLTVKDTVEPEVGQDTAPKIEPGRGVYRDTIAPRVCYKVKNSYIDKSTAFIILEKDNKYVSLSFLQRRLKAALPELPEKENYLSSIQDTDHSMSLLNYYFSPKQDVQVKISGFGREILNEVGKQCYYNCKNPSFQSQCGDSYISSYSEGALLTMSMIVKVNSAEAKEALNKEAGRKLTFENAAAVIKNAVQKSKISGSVTTQALQIGGEPSRLSTILNRNNDGYYALTCDFTEIDCCIKAVNSFLNYTAKDFPKQFDLSSRKGIVSLGLGLTSSTPISDDGLEPRASADS